MASDRGTSLAGPGRPIVLNADPTPDAADEPARLNALYRLGVLDSMPAQEFDEIVALAAAICGTPFGLFSLVDRDRVWYKSVFGGPGGEVPRDASFCTHAIQQPGLTLIQDATQDQRVADSIFVTGEVGIRFYAGVRVHEPDGHAVGALCVLDDRPRGLTEQQMKALRILGRQVEAHLQLLVRQRELEEALRWQREVSRHLEQGKRQLEDYLNHTSNIVALKSPDLRYLFYNQRFADHHGISMTAWLGRTDEEMRPAALAEQVRQHDLSALDGDPLMITHTEADAAGQQRVLRVHHFTYDDAAGGRLIANAAVDVTNEAAQEAALAEANRKLALLSTTDALTAITNRRGFDEALLREWRRAARSGNGVSLLLIDVDHFKRLNDAYGHLAGDECLRRLAGCLRDHLGRAGDLVTRYGGEEFTVLLADVSGEPGNAKEVAEHLRTAVEAMGLTHPDGTVTVSIGVATTRLAQGKPEDLVRAADEALYQAKAGGRNQVRVAG